MNTEHAPRGSPNATDTVRRAAALMHNGSVAEPARELQSLLDSDPYNVEALYLLAACQRYLKRYEDALTTLRKLKSVDPGFGRASQEEGHVLWRMNDYSGAIAAYEKAVSRNPALLASWRALADLYQSHGNIQATQRAQLHLQFLSKLPEDLLAVASLIHENRLLKAERLCRRFLKQNPRHVEAMRQLAILGTKLHVYDDAEFLLESSLVFEPNYTPARLEYVRVLQKRQKFRKALEQAVQLRASQPDNPVFNEVFASASMAAGDIDTALRTYDFLIERNPQNKHAFLLKGHALKTVGRQVEAIQAYRNASLIKPAYGDAYWSLANLKTYLFTDEELDQMQAAEQAAATHLTDRIHLSFALGKAFEDRKDFSRSFHHYTVGNALKKDEGRYSAERTEVEFENQISICNADLFRSRRDDGYPAPDPIFIVGLPRAGSTLLEQILSSHSKVDGTMELPNILAIAHRLNGRRLLHEGSRYPGVLQSLTAEKLYQLGEKYIENTRLFRKTAPFFIDKMPNNFRHIGLIHLILPNAKIIDARRNPMDCCLSGFKQLFAEGQYFTYSLEDIGRYYKGYVKLMEHWDRVLPGKILRVQHEDVVTNLESQVRRLLDFCGLEFEASCVSFHQTHRSVRTASSEQVRRPIYADSVGQWRSFESYLAPLKRTLAPVLEGYSPSSL